jgi:arsenate reductase (thioredoxin)
MATKKFNVLFLCTGNSARSIMAEALLNRLGQSQFRGFSAGSHPKGQVHPLALRLLQERGISTSGLRSKSWDEFAAAGAPVMDLIVTVCDNAAGEVCPVWPGQPATVHWSIQDPAAVEGAETERMRAFERAARELETRIRLLLALRLDKSDPHNLKQRLDRMGRGGNEENQ